MNKINLLTQVKSYLKKSSKERPVLRTVQHKDNHQFICNGYSLFIFNNHIESLDILPQTIDELSINYKCLLNSNKGNFETITPEYKFVFENLKKYVKWCKAFTLNEKCAFNSKYLLDLIPLDGRIFNFKHLLDFIKLNTEEFDSIKYLNINDINKFAKPIHLISNSMESLILPYDANKELKNNVIFNFNIFKLEEVKNGNKYI